MTDAQLADRIRQMQATEDRCRTKGLQPNRTRRDNRGPYDFKRPQGFSPSPLHYQVFMNNPIGGNSGSPYLSDRSPDYLPWAGSVPIGSTYLHHEHLVAKFRNLVTFGLHNLYTWTPDDHWSAENSMQTDHSNGMAQSSAKHGSLPT